MNKWIIRTAGLLLVLMLVVMLASLHRQLSQLAASQTPPASSR